jgi:hydroxysqualene synthase
MPDVNEPIQHYENFPVASWLCPPLLRSPIRCIYHFARTADDLADEGDASAAERLADLAAYRLDLLAIAKSQTPSTRWAGVFLPLQQSLVQFNLPLDLLLALLDAFTQDVKKTSEQSGYEDCAELLDYCSRSANPVGRLLLHLYGLNDEADLRLSDDICSALQLINFWQDLSQDIPRGRFYLTAQDLARFGVSLEEMKTCTQTPRATALIAHNVLLAKEMMIKGSHLVYRVPGRAGWELRAVVQGGLRILEKIESMNFATLTQRPRLRWQDGLPIVWRCLWMKRAKL